MSTDSADRNTSQFIIYQSEDGQLAHQLPDKTRKND